VVELALAGFV
jgi:hypothetical protein